MGRAYVQLQEEFDYEEGYLNALSPLRSVFDDFVGPTAEEYSEETDVVRRSEATKYLVGSLMGLSSRERKPSYADEVSSVCLQAGHSVASKFSSTTSYECGIAIASLVTKHDRDELLSEVVFFLLPAQAQLKRQDHKDWIYIDELFGQLYRLKGIRGRDLGDLANASRYLRTALAAYSELGDGEAISRVEASIAKVKSNIQTLYPPTQKKSGRDTKKRP